MPACSTMGTSTTQCCVSCDNAVKGETALACTSISSGCLPVTPSPGAAERPRAGVAATAPSGGFSGQHCHLQPRECTSPPVRSLTFAPPVTDGAETSYFCSAFAKLDKREQNSCYFCFKSPSLGEVSRWQSGPRAIAFIRKRALS